MSQQAETVIAQVIKQNSIAVANQMGALLGQMVKAHGIGSLTPFTVKNIRGETITTNEAEQRQRLIDNTADLVDALNDIIDRLDGGEFIEEPPSRGGRKARKPRGG